MRSTWNFLNFILLFFGVSNSLLIPHVSRAECVRCKRTSGSVSDLVERFSSQQTSEIFYHGIDGDSRGGTFDFADLAGSCLLSERDQKKFQENCVIQKRKGKMAPWTEVMSRREDVGVDPKTGLSIKKDCEVFIDYMAKNYCIDNPKRTSFYWKVAQKNLDYKAEGGSNFIGKCDKEEKPIPDKKRGETPYSHASNQLQSLTCPSGKRVEIQKHAFRAAIAVARTINAEAGICVDLDENMKPSSRQFEMVARVLMNRADDCAKKAKNNKGSDLRKDFCQTPGDKKPIFAKQGRSEQPLPAYVPWLEEVVAKHGAFDPWRDPQYGGGPNSPLALFTALCPATSQNANLFRNRGLVDLWNNINLTPDEEDEEVEAEGAAAAQKVEARKPAVSSVENATDKRFNYAVGLAMEMVYCKDDFTKRTKDFEKATYFVHGKKSIPAHLVRENRFRVPNVSANGIPVVPTKRAGMCEVFVSEASVHDPCDFKHLTGKEVLEHRASIAATIAKRGCTKEKLNGFVLPSSPASVASGKKKSGAAKPARGIAKKGGAKKEAMKAKSSK